MLQVKCFVLFCALFLYTTCEGGVLKEYDSNQSRDEKSNYYLSTEKVSYYDAVQMCHEKDMQLVSIETYDKNKKIFKFLNGSINESFWSSGMRFSESGRLGWLKGECFDYDNLKSSSYSNRCIEVSKTLNELVWNMQNCDQALRFICEKLKKEVTNPKCEDYSEDLVHGNTLPNKKYYIGRETITNSKALQVCRSMCMRLVSIESNEKNQDLYEAIDAEPKIRFWTSGHFKPANVWKWTNGKVVDFSSWMINEPNNGRHDEYCIEIKKDNETMTWNDQPCEDKRIYICETIDKESVKAD